MELSTIANVATSLTVLIAVAFGVIEMRRARLEREERAAFRGGESDSQLRMDEVDDGRPQYP